MKFLVMCGDAIVASPHIHMVIHYLALERSAP